MSERLPNADNLIVDSSKVTDYLLSLSHRDGNGKAKFFIQFGFSPENPEKLEASLRKHGLTQPVVNVMSSEHGVKYVVECALSSPDGGNPCIRSVWIVDAGNIAPRLVTAFPNS